LTLKEHSKAQNQAKSQRFYFNCAHIASGTTAVFLILM